MKNSGFSLIELMIVLTIIATLSMSVIPVFRGTFQSLQDDHAVRDLVATIRYAQERAVTDTTELRLYLDQNKNQYYVARLMAIGEHGKVFEPIAERYGEPVTLADRQSLNKPKAKFDNEKDAHFIAFYPNGACDEATIPLKKSDGGTVRIETNGAIGRLKVQQ